MQKHLLPLLALCFAVTAQAQAQRLRSHPTTLTEYTGHWRVIKIDNKLPSNRPPPAAFQADCQFFIHEPGGRWDHVTAQNMAGPEQTSEMCGRQTPESIAALRLASSKGREYVWTATKTPGLFITQHEQTQRGFLWKVDTVEADFDASRSLGVELKPRDLIIQFWNTETHLPMWALVLRPME